MKYFTRGWANGEFTDEEDEGIRLAYDERLRLLASQLSPAMARLACISLHDGLIGSANWSAGRKQLRLGLVVGTSEHGYRRVDLLYRGAMLGKDRLQALQRAARDRETTVAYHEVDVEVLEGERIFVHRLLLFPTEEVTLDFRELELTETPLADSRVHLGDWFSDED
jgi:hypothetical protein